MHVHGHRLLPIEGRAAGGQRLVHGAGLGQFIRVARGVGAVAEGKGDDAVSLVDGDPGRGHVEAGLLDEGGQLASRLLVVQFGA